MPDHKSGPVGVSNSLACEQYRRLLDDFAEAAREVLHLHAEQVNAMLQGDVECSRFDLLIHVANERKQEAKYKFIRHVQEHGCS
jgi:hypothetical protein